MKNYSKSTPSQPYHTLGTQKGGSTVESTLVQWLSKGISPEQTRILGRFSVVHMGELAPKSIHTTGLARGSPLLTSQPNSVKRVLLKPLPPEQPRVVIPHSHFSKIFARSISIASRMTWQVSTWASSVEELLLSRIQRTTKNLPLLALTNRDGLAVLHNS